MSAIEEAKKLLECHIPPTHEYHKLEIYIEYKLLENLITELEVAEKTINDSIKSLEESEAPFYTGIKALKEYEELK